MGTQKLVENKNNVNGVRMKMNTRLMIVFPGQGTQYVGMYRKLVGDYSKAADFMQKASEISGLDLENYIENATEEKLAETQIAQPAIFLTEYVMYRKLAETYKLNPVFMAGHSLGEITALACSGALDFEGAVKLVSDRGRFMSQVDGDGTMAAIIGIPAEEVEAVCQQVGRVVVSNYNSPVQTIISGDRDAVEKAGKELEAKKAIVKKMKVSGAFHSFHMEQARDQFVERVKETQGYYFENAVVANYDAKPYSSKETMVEKLSNQLVNSVRWTDILKYAEKMDINTIIEIGPGNTLKRFTEATTPSIRCFSMSDENDRERIDAILEKKEKTDCDYEKLVTRCMAIAVCIQNKNENSTEYENGVAIPYKKLKNLQTEIENRQSEATEEEARTAVGLLRQIMDAKKASAEVQKMRIHQLLFETGTLETLADLR